MKSFLIITDDGKIVQSLWAADGSIVPVPDGHSLATADSIVDPTGFYVSADDTLIPIPPRPSEHHVFDYEAKEWTDPRTLEDLRAAAHARIERWRDEQERTGITFEHAGHTWDGGLATRTRLMPVLSLPALPGGFFWTDADNADVPMDLPALQALAAAHELAIVQRGFAIHVRQREMKSAIETMTAAQLDAFEPAWPAQPE